MVTHHIQRKVNSGRSAYIDQASRGETQKYTLQATAEIEQKTFAIHSENPRFIRLYEARGRNSTERDPGQEEREIGS